MALVSIIVLLLLSDFAPPRKASFDEIGEEEFRVTCLIVEWRESESGWVLTLQDIDGNTLRGFCRYEVVDFRLEEGTLVEISGRASDDNFLFINSIQRCT